MACLRQTMAPRRQAFEICSRCCPSTLLRIYDKVLRLSRTIADLDGTEDLAIQHLSEAIQYRRLNRNLFA